MSKLRLSPEELLAGADFTFDLVIPNAVLRPTIETKSSDERADNVIRVRPLTIGKFQLIMKAARNDSTLIPLLMIKESVVDPVLSLEQVKELHLGLVNFLIENIREISGLTQKKSLGQQ